MIEFRRQYGALRFLTTALAYWISSGVQCCKEAVLLRTADQPAGELSIGGRSKMVLHSYSRLGALC